MMCLMNGRNRMENTLQSTLYGFDIRESDNRRTYDRSERKVYEIKALWQRQHEIINLALTGMSNKDIAKILNISTVSVSSALNSELGMKKLSALREKRDESAFSVSEEIKKLTIKALSVYKDIFDAPPDQASLKLKMEAANTVCLDLAGHRAPTKIDTRSVSFSASLEEIEEFKRRGIEAAKAAGLLVDIKQVERSETSPDSPIQSNDLTNNNV